jgi:uncharacterized repeat protein (TIGR01451 family)
MRRILWTLATCGTIGASLTWTVGQERFTTNPFQSGTSARGSTLFSPKSQTPADQPVGATALPGTTLFGDSTTAAAPKSGLFGTSATESQPQAYRRDPSATFNAGERFGNGFVTPVSATEPAGAAQKVVFANYERLPGQREEVQQVRGQDPARETPQIPTRSLSELSRMIREKEAARTAGTTRLTQPVSTTGEQTSTDAYARLNAEARPSRGVTFTRATVDPRPASAPPAPVAAKPTAVPVTAPIAQPIITDSIVSVGTGMNEIQRGSQSPTVTLEWVTRGGVNVGQESDCDLIVKNTGIISAREIEVAAHFPTNVRIISVEPQPKDSSSHLSWSFAELQPGQEQTIKIKLIPTERGSIDTHADVRFSGTAATSLVVAEPMIEVVCSGPAEVLVGEPASQTVVVKNPGNGIATNVTIETVVPAGLEHARGERLVMDVGSLNPGESRSVRLALAATKGGRCVIQVQARADGDLVRNTTSEVHVIAPSLVSEVTGPGLRYLGRNATYTIKVRNDGAITTENVRVMHKVPEGFEVVESDKGAQYDRPNRLVNWFVGRLTAGQAAEMKVTLRSDKIGNFTHFVRATSEHGAISDAQFSTSVEGTPALAMEITDLDDPVEVGNETAYEITVTNEGSAPARSVALVCEIPAGLNVLKANGPVDCIKQKDSVSFNPVVELAPGNSITYRVHVIGTTGGHHRLRARLTSDSTPEALTADELTKFYGE